MTQQCNLETSQEGKLMGKKAVHRGKIGKENYTQTKIPQPHLKLTYKINTV